MSISSTSSGDKCTGKNCRGTIVFTPQVQDLISGPNPDIVKAASMLVPCAKCKSLASSPKEKIVTVLDLHGVHTLPKRGVDAITFAPKNVRYNPDAVGGTRTGWQYRCGNDSFNWYDECTHPRCMGMGKFDDADFIQLFAALFTAVRAAPGSEQADLTPVFDMCQHCGYGHPAACGELQVAELRSAFMLNALKKCTASKCTMTSCSRYHDTAEKNRVRKRLEDYVKDIQKKANHQTKWGDNNSALHLDEAAPAAATVLTASAFPVLAPSGFPTMKTPAPKPQVTVPPTLIAPAAPQVVVKSQVEDDNLSIDDVHKKYVADLRARAIRDKAKKIENSKEITRLNKEIERLRAENDRLDVDSEKAEKLVSMLNSMGSDADVKSKSSSASSAKYKEVVVVQPPPEVTVVEKRSASIKKKAISSLSSPAPVQIKSPASLPELADSDPVVDVNLSDDVDPLSGSLVILQPVNA